MIVADASVGLKWIFANEQGAEQALHIRNHHVSGQNVIAVPSLFFYEAANVLATKVKLPPEAAQSAFQLFLDFELEVFEPDNGEYLEAISLASERKISAYDAIYIVLARRLGCRMITADEKLWRKTMDLCVDLLAS